MYGYEQYSPLTPENILSRVSQQEIFEIVFKEGIQLDREHHYKAPYRDDTVPDCYFEKVDRKIYFVDFAASGKKSLTCFNFIMKVYNVSFYDSLEVVNRYYSLGLGDNTNSVKKIIENDYVEEENIKKSFKKRVITVLPRLYIYKDRNFWHNYEISKENLVEDLVLGVELYQSTNRIGETFSVRPTKLCYAYTDFPDGRKKIYTPYGDKLEKWFTNCSQDDVGSIQHLPSRGRLLIITKSYKDCRVLRNQGLNAVWFQNEGMIPNMEILIDLCNRFDNIVIWFDNDSAGIANSRVVTELFNSITPNKARSIMLPPRLLQLAIKDPSDLIHKKGKVDLTSFLANKQLFI